MPSLLIGAVTTPPMLPANASSTPFLTNAIDAAPVRSAASPNVNGPSGFSERIQHSNLSRRREGLLQIIEFHHAHAEVQGPTVSSMTGYEPMTRDDTADARLFRSRL